MKLCKDCVHWSPGHGLNPFRYCRNPKAKRDPETGLAFSKFERTLIGNCGEEGRLFEGKPGKPIGFFKRIFG